MRKILLWILLVLLLIILIMPLVTGSIAKRQFEEAISLVKETQELEINVESYKHRWFASKAHFSFSLADLQRLGVDIDGDQFAGGDRLNFMADIYHGPIILSDNKFTIGQNYMKIYQDRLAEHQLENSNQISLQGKGNNIEMPLATILVHLNGYLHTKVNLPMTTFTWDFADGRIISHALTGDWFLSGKRGIKANMTADQIKFELPEYQLKSTMEPITMSYEIHYGGKRRYKNKIDLSSPLVNMYYDDSQLQIEQFQLALKPFFENNLLSTSINLDVDHIRKDGLDYGSIDLGARIDRLDTQNLFTIAQGIIDLNKPGLSQQQHQIIVLNMLLNLPRLFSHRVEFEIDHFNFTIPTGEIKAEFYLQLPDSKDILSFDYISIISNTNFETSLQLPIPLGKMLLASYLQSKYFLQQDKFTKRMKPTNISLPVNKDENGEMTSEQMVEKARAQASEQLDAWVEQGIIKQVDRYYLFHIELYKGKLVINDQTIIDLHQD